MLRKHVTVSRMNKGLEIDYGKSPLNLPCLLCSAARCFVAGRDPMSREVGGEPEVTCGTTANVMKQTLKL